MPAFGTLNFWFALVRACHFAACLLLMGAFIFDRVIATSFAGIESGQTRGAWQRTFKILVGSMLPAALLSGIAWVALTCIAMTGLPPREALTAENLAIIWNQTHFGTVWKWRLGFWVATLLLWVLSLFARGGRNALAWSEVAIVCALSASLAWTGHAMLEESGWWHLAADVLHVAVCGVWPGMLVPFLLVLLRLCRSGGAARWTCLIRMTLRFSSVSLAAVCLLTASGLVNAWFLLGPISNLIATLYGNVLLFKIVAFGGMVGLGAVNLLYLRPRICADMADPNLPRCARAARWLQVNVMIEIILAAAVVYAVGCLGMTAPPAQPTL